MLLTSIVVCGIRGTCNQLATHVCFNSAVSRRISSWFRLPRRPSEAAGSVWCRKYRRSVGQSDHDDSQNHYANLHSSRRNPSHRGQCPLSVVKGVASIPLSHCLNSWTVYEILNLSCLIVCRSRWTCESLQVFAVAWFGRTFMCTV